MLQINSINFKYPGKRNLLLKKVRFRVELGEQLYLCGKSGQGKSTLLKIINGLLDPTAGTIRLEKKRVFGPRYTLVPGHEYIRLVDQEFKLMPNHTVFENIVHHLDYYTQREKNARAKHLGEILEITSIFNKIPKELSGGEKQRVAIAKALANPPKLLLLDEPFAHLDYQTQERTQGLVNKLLREEQITSITVTHHPNDALRNADRIIFFHNGEIRDEGPPEELYIKPKTIESANFFGLLNEVKKGNYVRPENLYLSQKGEEFTISNKTFAGQFWEFAIENKDKNWKWYSSENVEIGKLIKISYNKKSVISIT